MRTLRRIQTASMRIAPHWALSVILAAYFTVRLVSPGYIVS